MESSIQNLQLNMSNKKFIGMDPGKGDFTAVIPMPSTDQDKAIAEQICSIITLAVLNASVLHIDVEYFPWLSSFTVKVFDTNPVMKIRPPCFHRLVPLERPDAVKKLKELEDLLIDKVAAAKDKLMGAV